MTDRPRVVIGADTHLDTIHVATLTETGKPLADAEFPAHPSGYYVAIKWAQSYGEVAIAGVEGTGSYGAGFTRALQETGIEVAEVAAPTAPHAGGGVNPIRSMPTPRPVPRWPATVWPCPKTSTPAHSKRC